MPETATAEPESSPPATANVAPDRTGTSHAAPEKVRATCRAFRGSGRQLTTADHLREIVEMLPADDPAKLDGVIAEFYSRLVGNGNARGAAPHLREFFPADLITGDALNSRGNRQRDMLLAALTDVLSRYDPDDPQSEGMRALLENARTWGRSHSEWRNRNGGIYIPTEEDYLAVRNVLAQLLGELIGSQFGPEHVRALVAAYRTVSLEMQRSADAWRMERGPVTVARAARQEVPR